MAVVESFVVVLIVAGCAVFSVWRLLSARLRLRVLDGLTRFVGHGPDTIVARLRRKTIAQLAGGGCGACSRATGLSQAPRSSDMQRASPAAAIPQTGKPPRIAAFDQRDLSTRESKT